MYLYHCAILWRQKLELFYQFKLELSSLLFILLITCSNLYPGIPNGSWSIAITYSFCSTALNSGSMLRMSAENINGDAMIDHTAIWALLWSNVIPLFPITNYVLLLWPSWFKDNWWVTSRYDRYNSLHQRRSKLLGVQFFSVPLAAAHSSP